MRLKMGRDKQVNEKKMKICVITPVFGIAGVPLAQIRFARALAAAGHDVDLVIGQINHGCKLPIVEDVNVLVLNKPRVALMLIPVIRYLKENNPAVVFSAEDHLNGTVLLAAIISGSKAKISGSSRVPPSDTYSNIPFTKRWIQKLFMRVVMPRANALTCVSKDMVDQYRCVFKSPPHTCVYNIVNDHNSQKKLIESVDDTWFVAKNEPLIVAAGTLTQRKGFPDLILAMKELTKLRKAKLVIFGEGPMRSELQVLIDELDLGSVVKLFGHVENPLKYFSRADIFVLSSYAEGLPNVLVEAMMCGCTPVSTDCPTGPREVIQEDKYGYLVPLRNPVAMAAGIEKAIKSPIPMNLLQEAIKPFSEQEVIERHFDILGI